MNSNANEKFNAAGDRPLGAARPVDPATRLSELLAQSLEELTRPFDPPRVDPLLRTPPGGSSRGPSVSANPIPLHQEPPPTASRLDDKALAELEAELFAAAAAKPAAKAASTPAPVVAEPVETPPPVAEKPAEKPADEVKAETPKAEEPKADAAPIVDPFVDRVEQAPPAEVIAPVKTAEAPKLAPATDADAERVIARVKRLMLVSLAVTLIAVGSVFGLIGYRLFKGEGSSAKIADKLPAPAAGSEMTLSLPRDARIVQSAVAEDRLIVTLDVGGKTEVRTYDLKTLQPAGRLTFSATP